MCSKIHVIIKKKYFNSSLDGDIDIFSNTSTMRGNNELAKKVEIMEIQNHNLQQEILQLQQQNFALQLENNALELSATKMNKLIENISQYILLISSDVTMFYNEEDQTFNNVESESETQNTKTPAETHGVHRESDTGANLQPRVKLTRISAEQLKRNNYN